MVQMGRSAKPNNQPNKQTGVKYILGLFGFFFTGGSPTNFGLGRGPITPPDPAIVRTDRKDLDSNKRGKMNRSVCLSSPYVIPDSTTPFVPRAWWTSSTVTGAASGCPPDCRRPPPARGMSSSWPGVLTSPGRRPFLPGLLSPPYPTSRSPAMNRTGRKGFHPTKQKQTKVMKP